MDFNLDNVSTTSSGNTRFSGVSSGIDSQSIIDSIISAKRIQVTRIEDKISLNNEKASAFAELKTLSAALATSLDVLRGSTSFFSTDVFESKVAYSDSRVADTAAAGHVASSASAILAVSASDDAQAGTHVVEVVQLARAQQIRSDAFTSKTDTLADLGYTTGDITINGQTISISGTDTMLELRDKINAANKGADATGVTASIVSVSSTEHYLVLGSDDTGLSNVVTFGGDQAVHNSFGFTSAGTDTVKTEIQAAQNAIVRVDNLGVDIERESNTIDDIFTGVTLDLYKAEEGTEIVIDIEHDLNTVKESVVDFLNAYNDLKAFIEDQQTESIREDGGDAEYGVLAFDSTLRKIEQQMGSLISSEVPGLENGFASLGQIGVEIESDFSLSVDDEVFDNALLNNLDDVRRLFVFDYSTSDPRVTIVDPGKNATYTTDVDGNVNPYYINIAGTDVDGNVTDANISTSSGVGTLGDGSLDRSGNVMTASSNTAVDGMKFFFNGDANLGPVTDIEVRFTRGVADRMFNFLDDMTKVGGELETIQTNILSQNEDYDDDIAKIESRLEVQRAGLEARFIAMETAMLQINNLKDSISQQIDAMSGE